MAGLSASFTMTYSKTAFSITVFLIFMNIGCAQNNECSESRCSTDEPPIRFPFRLVGEINNHCRYPGFDISCNEYNKTVLELPGFKFEVWEIQYASQEIIVSRSYNSKICLLPTQFINLNHSPISPFQFKPLEPQTANITFFNCSSLRSEHQHSLYYRYAYLSSYYQNFSVCPIYSARSNESALDLGLLFCTKMDEVSPGPFTPLVDHSEYLVLQWSNPTCGECEAKGQRCRFKNNASQGEIECFDHRHNRSNLREKILKSTILAAIGGTVGAILLGVMIFHIYHFFRMRGQDQARVEKFLEDYRALRPARFSYADIKRVTKNFKDRLGEGAHGQVFKGELSNEILVAVKILNNTGTEADEKEFMNEVGTMGKIHHINLIRLLGYCADGFHRALVYEFFSNGSLQKFISPPDNDIFLGWEKMQQIAIGIAKGVEYLHQGCDHQILHFDINPRNVLLDDCFIPKISDFGLSKLCPRNQSRVSMTAARGTLGYIAPEVFSRNFGNVSYKSDVYSYGMLLLEMAGGRKNMNATTEEFQILYPKWIHNLLEGKDTHMHVENEEDIKIVKKLATVGLWCIQWNPMDRPSMKFVVQMLEGDANKLRVPPNPFDCMASRTIGVTPARPLNFELEVIEEAE